MKVLKNEKQSCIGGLRFIDEHGGFIVDRNFWAESARVRKNQDEEPLTDKTKVEEKTWAKYKSDADGLNISEMNFQKQ